MKKMIISLLLEFLSMLCAALAFEFGIDWLCLVFVFLSLLFISLFDSYHKEYLEKTDAFCEKEKRHDNNE